MRRSFGIVLLLALGCTASTPAGAPGSPATRDHSRLEANKALVRRLYAEVWNQGNEAAVDELIAETWLRSDAGQKAVPTSREVYKEGARKMRQGLPDFHVTLDDMVAEGDKVAFRFTSRGTHTGELFGVPPTGKAMEWTGISFVRVENSRVQEMWSSFDQYGMMRQLGLIPSQGG